MKLEQAIGYSLKGDDDHDNNIDNKIYENFLINVNL